MALPTTHARARAIVAFIAARNAVDAPPSARAIAARLATVGHAVSREQVRLDLADLEAAGVLRCTDPGSLGRVSRWIVL